MVRLLALLVVLAGPALGQDVEGTWEMTAVENLPYEDDLVFARMTFADGDLFRTSVFLDPDDGELIGQISTERYLLSDGQVVVRGGRDVTVLDVVRTPGEMTVRDLETGVLLRLRAADPGGALDPALFGRWRSVPGGAGDVEGAAASLALEFFPDGTVSVQNDDGDLDRADYVVAGPYVLIGDEPSRYRFVRADSDRRLVLSGEGGETTFSQGTGL